jgi:hydroxymethylpyrimidine pyrophosphatase-like HAD family hydrolase
MRKTIVAVDFDGTICENDFPKIGKPIKDVIEILKKLDEEEVILILWTCREGELLEEALEYCAKYEIPIHYVNENYPELPFKTSNKIYADFYIDDRAHSVDWRDNYKKIMNHEKDEFIKV